MNQKIIIRRCDSLEQAEIAAIQIEKRVRERWRDSRWSDSEVKVECRSHEFGAEIILTGKFGEEIDITGLIQLSN